MVYVSCGQSVCPEDVGHCVCGKGREGGVDACSGPKHQLSRMYNQVFNFSFFSVFGLLSARPARVAGLRWYYG